MRKKLLTRARRAIAELAVTAKRVTTNSKIDREWYLRAYPDVAGSGADPAAHFVEVGKNEGRYPSPETLREEVSGVFDSAWYLVQNPDVAQAGMDPLEHYVLWGYAEGRAESPERTIRLPASFLVENALSSYERAYSVIKSSAEFDTDWYIATYTEGDADEIEFLRADPIAHYVHFGAEAGFDPSPWFSTVQYLERHADVRTAGENPFSHYLAHGRSEGRDLYTIGFRSERWRIDREEWLARHKLDDVLVSIVMPTRNRQAVIGRAIESVLAQTWNNWELLIVDDGSTDDTVSLLRNYSDRRIQYFANDGAPGVSGARNSGLKRAKGSLIAYLDSDNEWVPEYLRYMVSELQCSGAESAYAVLEARLPSGKVEYLAKPWSRDELLWENFIDLNVYVHRRTTWERHGGFDESLRRMVDWDLIIRYTNDAPPAFAFFVGVYYSTSSDLLRITQTESVAWLYAIRNRYLIEWERVFSEVAVRREDLVSVVMCVSGRPGATDACLQSLFSTEAGAAFELIIVDNGSDAETRKVLADWSSRHSTIKLITFRGNNQFALGSNLGFAASLGAKVVFLRSDTELCDGWLVALTRPLKDPVVKGTQPRVVDRDGRLQSVGLVFSGKTPLAYGIYEGFPGDFEPTMKPRRFSALTGVCFAVRAIDFARLRGFDPLFINGLEDVDFCLRLGGGQPVFQYVPDSLIVRRDAPASGQREHLLQNRQHFVANWNERIAGIPTDDVYYQQDGVEVLSRNADLPDWFGQRHAVWQPVHSPDVKRIPFVVRRAQRQLSGRTVAIKTPCPERSRREHWGDYHFAVALEAALQRRGVSARVDFLNEWYTRSNASDINLVLRGLSRFIPQRDTLNIMWHLSHPLAVDSEEFNGFDHVFVASNTWAEALSSRVRAPVEALAQCTDATRFMPEQFDTTVRHELLYVANSRKQERAVVLAAKAADMPISIYGEMWEGLAPAEWVKGSLVPNHELPAWYAGAGVVLNDHWPDMRNLGFVSNRIYDALACGAPVVSDNISDLSEELRSGVVFFSDADSFKSAIEAARSRPGDRSPEAYELSRYVRTHHSFDARANAIIRVVSRLLAHASPPGIK